MSATDADLRAIEAFLFREARLLDEARFEDWLALFAEDGRYWVPSRPDQDDPLSHASIMYEDRAVLEMRVARLAHPRAYAVDPPPRTTHLVGNVQAAPSDRPAESLLDVRSALIMTEVRPEQTTVYSGAVHHRLRPVDSAYEIVLKRVDLANADGVHGVITVPF